MGLQTDLFVGSVQEAVEYDGAATNVERAQLGGLTNLEFETLRAIIAGEEWDVKRHALEETASTESSWTFRFPEGYIDALVSLSRQEMNRAALAWSATEEIASSPSDVLPVIESLVSMARLAAAQKRDLFVWTAL